MLGVHVSKISKVLDNTKRTTLLAALQDDCGELNLTAAQIYTHGPRNSRANNLDHKKIKKWATENKIALYVHSSYLTVSLWNLNDATKDLSKVKGYVRLLDEQLAACKKIGALGLVIHFPSKPLDVVVKTLECSMFKIIAARHGVPILFEMKPIKNKGIKGSVQKGYVTTEQLNAFCAAVKLPKELWGIVIDTAHLWGAGVDTTDKKSQDEWFDELTHPDMIKLIHLNGGQTKTFNSGRDEHFIVFSDADNMYGKYADGKTAAKCDLDLLKNSGIYSIVKFAMKKKLTIICEINRGKEREVRYSLELINRLAASTK